MAIKQYANLDFQGVLHPINVIDPTSAQDAATKNYVDSAAQGAHWKQEVQAATTAALAANTYNNGTAGVGATLTATANGALAAIDGYTPVLNDRLLIKNEVTSANNGWYSVTQVGDATHPYILTRTTDADDPTDLTSSASFVVNGTTNGNTQWIQTATIVTVGTTGMNFVQMTAQSAGLSNPVTIAQGGTGQTSAANARSASGLGGGFTPAGGATNAGLAVKVIQTLTAPTSAGSPYTITHNIGTQSVIVSAIDVTTNASIGVTWTAPSVNSVQVSFDTNEANNVNITVVG